MSLLIINNAGKLSHYRNKFIYIGENGDFENSYLSSAANINYLDSIRKSRLSVNTN